MVAEQLAEGHRQGPSPGSLPAGMGQANDTHAEPMPRKGKSSPRWPGGCLELRWWAPLGLPGVRPAAAASESALLLRHTHACISQVTG